MTLCKTLIGLSILLGLSACGIKPKELTPPSADEKGKPTVTYPRTYPDPTL